MAKKKPRKHPLNGDEFFEAADVSRTVLEYAALATIFAQGDLADSVLYIRRGTVKLGMVSRTGREDLIDQLFNSSEKRLARTLLLLARYGGQQREHVIPELSQELLAEMVGTTRSRVNFS